MGHTAIDSWAGIDFAGESVTQVLPFPHCFRFDSVPDAEAAPTPHPAEVHLLCGSPESGRGGCSGRQEGW